MYPKRSSGSSPRSSGSSPFLIKKKKARPLSDIYETSETEQSFFESITRSDLHSFPQNIPRFSTPKRKSKYVEPDPIILEKGVLSPDSPPTYQQNLEVGIGELPSTDTRNKNITISTTPLARRLSSHSASSTSRIHAEDSNSQFIDPIYPGIEPLSKIPIIKTAVKRISSKGDTSDLLHSKTESSNKSEMLSRSDVSEGRWSLIVSPMQSDDRELTPNSLERTIDVVRGKESAEKSSDFEHLIPRVIINEQTRQGQPKRYEDIASPSNREADSKVGSSISYISPTTTLFDFFKKSELDFTLPSASDITGSEEDYSIVFNRRYEKDIQIREQKKHQEALRKIQKQQQRRDQFEMFFIKGITWLDFSSEHIRFNLRPKELYPANFSSNRLYTFSMRFDGNFWVIKTFRVPEKQKISEMYNKDTITDENIQTFLEFVVKIVTRNIELEQIYKEEREADYFAGVEMDLNDSDLELFLNEEERCEYLERRERLWKNMMSPSIS